MKKFFFLLTTYYLLLTTSAFAQNPVTAPEVRIPGKAQSKVKRIQQPMTGVLFYRLSDSTMCVRNPDNSVTPLSGGGSGDYSPWDTTATAIIQKDTTLNVGIGTITPTAKLYVQKDGYYMSVDSGFFVFTDTGSTGGGIVWTPVAGNLNNKKYGHITGINYNIEDSTDLGCEVGIRESGGAHMAQIEFHGNTATGVGHVHIDVSDSNSAEIQFHIATQDSLVELSTNGNGFKIVDLAGSGTRVVTASATGVLGAGLFDGFTIDSNSNMYAGTGALPSLTTGGENFVTGIGAGVSITEDSSNVIVGFNADVLNSGVSSQSVIVGYQAFGGNQDVAIGYNAQSGSNGSVVIGNSCLDLAGSSIVIGFDQDNPSVTGGLLIGNANNPITEAYIGNNVTNSSPTSLKIQPSGSAGTNVAAGSLTLAGGKSTGNAAPGTVQFQTTVAGASGATLQTLVTQGRFDGSTTAGETRFMLYDVDNGTLERVTVGAADSGGAGFKVLRIPN